MSEWSYTKKDEQYRLSRAPCFYIGTLLECKEDLPKLITSALNTYHDPIALRNRLAELEGGCE